MSATDQLTCDWCGAPIDIREPYSPLDWGNFHVGKCVKEAAADAAISTHEEIGVEAAREEGKL
jgi:hypothetical protein